MKLTDLQLRQIYQAVVKTSGHPDPVGYMARAIVFSDGDPDYVDIEGKMGFMPVTPDRAMEEVGSSDVQSLQGNILTTLAMDIQYFSNLKTIEGMVIAFHEGIAALQQQRSEEMTDLLDALPQLRSDVLEILSPRLATVEDVIKLMLKNPSVSASRLNAFKEIVRAS